MASKKSSIDSEQQSGQNLVKTLTVSAVISMAIYFYIGFYYMPIAVPENPNWTDRIIFTLRWGIIEILPLVAGILVVGNSRGNNLAVASNPSDPKQVIPPGGAVHVRFVANTVEQILIHLPGLFALASYVQPENLKLIPMIALLFFIGRIIYWIGYMHKPLYRVYGFSFSTFPALCILGYATFCLLKSGATFGIQTGE